jgi:hypothetical protein
LIARVERVASGQHRHRRRRGDGDHRRLPKGRTVVAIRQTIQLVPGTDDTTTHGIGRLPRAQLGAGSVQPGWRSFVSALQIVLLGVAGIAAGTINTVVGSGTLVTFPVLLAFGYPPVTANVSNTIGLVPGSLAGAWGYRGRLVGQRANVVRLGAASLLGGLVGAVLLLSLPASTFDAIVPVFIAVALVLTAFQTKLRARLQRRARPGRRRGVLTVLACLHPACTAAISAQARVSFCSESSVSRWRRICNAPTG